MSGTTTIAVLGGTGFVGRYIVRELVSRGFGVRVLARERAKAARVLPKGVAVVVGDVLDPRAVDEVLSGAGGCVNAVGILRERRGAGTTGTFRAAHVMVPRLMVERCQALGVTRIVQVSALGVRDTGVSEYQRTKWEGEQAVRRSGLRWTVIRPSLIHGKESEFIALAKGWVSGQHPPYFFMPYFGRPVEDKTVPLGSVRLEDPVVAPVAVQDVARAVVGSLSTPAAEGEVYNVAGSESLTWPAMLNHLRDTLPGADAELEAYAIPADVAAVGAMVAEKVGLGAWVPFDEGMARMGAEDSTAELEKLRADLGFTPAGFRESVRAYAAGV